MADDALPPMAGTPTGASTLIEATRSLREQGFEADMFITDAGAVRCGACREDADPAQLEVHHVLRLEGASDPADMAAVLALACPRCGAKGTAVARYGPEAGPQDVAVLQAVEDERGF